MKCSACQFENREGLQFCERCGVRTSLVCTTCGTQIPVDSEFCGMCGERLDERKETATRRLKPGGERKYLTILFSDLSGYTALTARLDPEEVRDIMSHLFGEVSRVIAKYEGSIERYIGDAVMALFGAPVAHEDHAIRAIKAAKEIHSAVQKISLLFKEKIGGPMLMHSGINTGLVVTGDVNDKMRLPGIQGSAINLASRLQSIAGAGEILVGVETYKQAEGHFAFESLKPIPLKGWRGPVQPYRVLSQKEKPVTIHRISGVRAKFIGRKAEMRELREASRNLMQGKGAIFPLCGDPGTGKSRLLEEFKKTLDLQQIQWLEAHAHAYTRNIPYFPLIDLMNRVFEIQEGDPPEKLRNKIETGIKHLFKDEGDLLPYVQSLYTLDDEKLKDLSPESWKSRLQAAIHQIFTALARKRPTIFCIEDLHWADPSFVDLLQNTLFQVRQPVMVLCVYRPTFTLSYSTQLGGLNKVHEEMRLLDFSPPEASEMLASLLKTDHIPSDLRKFVQDKIEGNPFYLEELVNSLIESETLVREGDHWRTTKSLNDWEIPSTVHGVITSRLDRLEKAMKRTLQEASVIGRSFYYEILKRITDMRQDIDRCLRNLEQIDLIRTRAYQPDLEYIFKHALTQEVAYAGLLKKERQEIHERIGEVIELLYRDRLPEFYETLAYHFKNGQSSRKAVDYLQKAGEKCLSRYSVEESHQHFKEGYNILSSQKSKSREDKERIIDLLNKWGLAFYYRGDYKTFPALLVEHRPAAESLEDKSKLGIYYCWLGMALFHREQVREGYEILNKALVLGEKIEAPKVIANACLWLTWVCAELGLLDEAVVYGRKAEEAAKSLESEDLYCLALAGLGHVYWYQGETRKTRETGRTLIDYSSRISNTRGTVLGHYIIGCSHFMAGDFTSAIHWYEKATSLSADPYYSQWPQMLLCLSRALSGQNEEAELNLKDLLNYTSKFGVDIIGTPAKSIMGIVLIGKGSLKKGIEVYEQGRQTYIRKARRWCHALSEFILGTVYLEIIRREGLRKTQLGTRDLFFVLTNLPFLRNKAERHLSKSIDIAEEIGAKTTLGMSYLNLGLLYKSKRKQSEARECLSRAVDLFGRCEAEGYLNQANEALAALE